MAYQPDDNLPGFYFTSSAQKVADHVYATDGTEETPPGSHLYEFRVGDYAYPSYTPIPHVELTLFDITADTVTVTLYRTVKGRTQPVRGQVGVYAIGGRNVVDWDAPFNVPITYRAEQFDSNGVSLGYTAAFQTQLDSAQTWIHNVFDPINAVPVVMNVTAAGTIKRPTPTNLAYPAGSPSPIAILDQRRGVTDVDVSFLTFDEETADKVDGMFGNPYETPSTIPVLCIRFGSDQNLRLPKPFYALITDTDQEALNTGTGPLLTRWGATATEITPPAPVLINSVLTYDDIDASYDTYTAMDAAYGSYLERDRDYSLAGAAGATPPDTTPNPGTGGDTTDPAGYGQGTYGAGTYGS